MPILRLAIVAINEDRDINHIFLLITGDEYRSTSYTWQFEKKMFSFYVISIIS